MTAQWFVAQRNEDVTGISGSGPIAWVLALPHGHFMFWDTVLAGRPTQTWEWFDDAGKFDDIHGHDGATVLEPVAHADAERGRQLMRATVGRVEATFAELLRGIDDV